MDARKSRARGAPAGADGPPAKRAIGGISGSGRDHGVVLQEDEAEATARAWLKAAERRLGS